MSALQPVTVAERGRCHGEDMRADCRPSADCMNRDRHSQRVGPAGHAETGTAGVGVAACWGWWTGWLTTGSCPSIHTPAVHAVDACPIRDGGRGPYPHGKECLRVGVQHHGRPAGQASGRTDLRARGAESPAVVRGDEGNGRDRRHVCRWGLLARRLGLTEREKDAGAVPARPTRSRSPQLEV